MRRQRERHVLSEIFCEQLNFGLHFGPFVENAVDGFENRHVHLQRFIDFVHTFRAIIALGNHFHLDLRTFHRIAATNHFAKGAVAAEFAVGCHEQIAQIGAVVDAPRRGIHRFEKTFHFLYGVGEKHRLEVVAIFQPVANAGSDGINIFQHGGIFNADDVGGAFCLNEISATARAFSTSVQPIVR